MNCFRYVALVATAGMLAVAISVQAQDTQPAQPSSAPAAATPISQDLLDSLLAPIALYPDQLLTQVLMASTYPLEVVEAARFVKANPKLKGTALDDALKDKTWDPSVLSLAAFPQVLDMMNEHLDWTQRLGDAFLDDEAAVMRTAQSLRMKAQQAGNLQSNQEQKVVVQEKTIIIEPAQPQYVYVPVYNPTVIYGAWWAPAYRPWFWYPPPVWGYPPYSGAFAAGIFWGTAWAITANNWGWCRPNWSGNTVNININNNNIWVNRPQYRDRYAQNGNWNHNVEHRRGVAYRDTATGNKYRPTNNAGVQTRENYRGRDNVPRPSPGTTPGSGNVTRPSPGGSNNVTRPAPGGNNNVTRPSPGVTRPSPGRAITRRGPRRGPEPLRGRRREQGATRRDRRRRCLPRVLPHRRHPGPRQRISLNRAHRCKGKRTAGRRAALRCNRHNARHRSSSNNVLRPAGIEAEVEVVVAVVDKDEVANGIPTERHENRPHGHSPAERNAVPASARLGRTPRARRRSNADRHVGSSGLCPKHLRVAGRGCGCPRRCDARR